MIRPMPGGEDGRVMDKKSSRRWTMRGRLWLFWRIEHNASDRVSKMLGLLLHPNVSLAAK